MVDQIKRENFLEAKATVYRRESDFFDTIRTANNYSLIAHAGAIVALLGFIGAVGARIDPLWPIVVSLLPFSAGLILGGYALMVNASIAREDLRISVSSFIEAAHNGDIMHFTDTASGREKEIDKVFSAWRWSLACFLLGSCIGAASLSLVGWLPEQAPEAQLHLL